MTNSSLNFWLGVVLLAMGLVLIFCRSCVYRMIEHAQNSRSIFRGATVASLADKYGIETVANKFMRPFLGPLLAGLGLLVVIKFW